jgi:hypothetical protein
MQGPISKSNAIFERPFSIPGFDELLPAGEYDLETEIDAPPKAKLPVGAACCEAALKLLGATLRPPVRENASARSCAMAGWARRAADPTIAATAVRSRRIFDFLLRPVFGGVGDG